METLEKLKSVEKDHQYSSFENSLTERFAEVLRSAVPLFTVHVEEDLWSHYLNNIVDNHRQHYNCNCCKSFIRNYGNIVVMNEDGSLSSAVFDIENTPAFFKQSVYKMVEAIEGGKVNGVFISDEKHLGRAETNGWGHLSLKLPKELVNENQLKTASQLRAEKLEEFRMLDNALDSFGLETIETAVSVLQSDTLYRGDRQLGVAQWFKGVKEAVSKQRNEKIKHNIKWMYVSQAQAGYTHIRSSMIGTLLEDIQAGMPFDVVASRFAEKMNPENYQRSQSAPTAAGIRQAEQLVEKMGIADSLQRRYATIEEIPEFLWKAREKKRAIAAPAGGVFGNIVPKQSAPKAVDSSLPITTMTFDKFSRTVLPNVSEIEAKIDNPSRFMAMVTEAIEGSKNIMQWNNPFSWYYHGGVDGEVKRRIEREGGKYEDNDIRCSLIWESYTDLDLHCITPNGRKIYYGNEREGRGWLDVDMNVSRESKEPVENIRWSRGDAPNGKYEFRVDTYTDRENGSNPFKVELEVAGQVYTFFGEGGENFDQMVFEFEYYNGQISNLTTGDGSVETISSWGASQGEFVKVNGITTSPNLWGENPVKYAGNHTFFLLDGVQDLTEGKGRGFFNEMLTADLREIRKTLEAYTASTPIQGVENATAAGLGFSKESDWDLTLRVKEGNLTRLIKIDRID